MQTTVASKSRTSFATVVDKPVNYSKNVTIMSVGFFFIFFAFSTVQALSTTIIPNANLGHISLAILYFFFVVFCFLAPNMVNKLGPRVSMTIGACPYLFMVLAFLIPVNNDKGCSSGVHGCWSSNKLGWVAHIALNALVGMGAPLLWTGQGVYVGRCAVHHAMQTNIRTEEATSKYNGLFFSFFQANGILGCAGASAILSAHLDHALIFILAAASCAGVLVLFLFVKTVPPPVKQDGQDGAPLSAQSFAVETVDSISICDVFRQLVSEKKMTLLMPIIFYNGMSLGFLLADYTGSVVKVALGKDQVGKIIGRSCCLILLTSLTLFFSLLLLLLWRCLCRIRHGHLLRRQRLGDGFVWVGGRSPLWSFDVHDGGFSHPRRLLRGAAHVGHSDLRRGSQHCEDDLGVRVWRLSAVRHR